MPSSVIIGYNIVSQSVHSSNSLQRIIVSRNSGVRFNTFFIVDLLTYSSVNLLNISDDTRGPHIWVTTWRRSNLKWNVIIKKKWWTLSLPEQSSGSIFQKIHWKFLLFFRHISRVIAIQFVHCAINIGVIEFLGGCSNPWTNWNSGKRNFANW